MHRESDQQQLNKGQMLNETVQGPRIYELIQAMSDYIEAEFHGLSVE